MALVWLSLFQVVVVVVGCVGVIMCSADWNTVSFLGLEVFFCLDPKLQHGSDSALFPRNPHDLHQGPS